MSQAIVSLLSPIRLEKGCIRGDFFHGIEKENLFCLLQEWETRKDFERYGESENYKMLQRAMQLLKEPCEIISCAEFSKYQTDKGYKFFG